MTDEQIKAYVAEMIGQLKKNSINIASLDVVKPASGTTLPFVADSQLKSALVDDLKGSSSTSTTADWFEGG